MYYNFSNIIKIVLGIILSGLIGFNREKGGMNAGIRTHILVGLSAVLIQMIALDFAFTNNFNVDPLRLASACLQGIGFIGSGVILKGDKTIRGLTTAASIFFVACIGLAVGTGFYVHAIVATIVAYIFLEDFFKLKKIISVKRAHSVKIIINIKDSYNEHVLDITDIMNSLDVAIDSFETSEVSEKESKIVLQLKIHDEIGVNDIIANLMKTNFVLKSQVVS